MIVKFSDKADRNFAKLDSSTRTKVLKKVSQIENLQNPRTQGEALIGNLAGLWKYRVGNYRIICKIKDEILEILVIKIAHRSEAYK